MLGSALSDHILVVGSSAYDLRKVIFWADQNATKVTVQFEGFETSVELDRTAFETKKTASLAAGG